MDLTSLFKAFSYPESQNLRMATFNQRGHSALWGAKLENGHFHPTRSFCTLRDKHWEWPLSSNKVNLHSEKQEWRMATFIQQGMDIYLFCYDVGFIATAPSFIAMSQGNHMDLMTFLSSSACGCVPRDQLATFTQQGHSVLSLWTLRGLSWGWPLPSNYLILHLGR